MMKPSSGCLPAVYFAISAAFLLRVAQCQVGNGVKTEVCSKFYNFTALPNIFSHQTQDEAIFHMRTFFPLINTFCSEHLMFFTCSVFLPPLNSSRKSPCRSLCEEVYNRCSYARDQLKFKWPEEISCEKFPDASCYGPRNLSKARGNADIEPGKCTETNEQSICSIVRINENIDQPYFSAVNKKFTNYFNHTSQEQAIYELSKHVKVIMVLASNRNYNSTTCIQFIIATLCTLHLPRCGKDVGLTESDCKRTFDFTIRNNYCGNSVTAARRLGYFISWPPVQLRNCDLLPSTANCSRRYDMKKFNLLIPPPPPSVRYTAVNSGVANFTWKLYPPSFRKELASCGFEVLYKLANSKATYGHVHVQQGNTSALIADLSLDKHYEVFVAGLMSRVPGVFEKLDYIHGTTIHDIPSTVDVCRNYYDRTLLPNSFGDKSINDAKSRMYKFFPLVYTLCSQHLTQFTCSVHLPRFNPEINARQLPCRSSCDRIYKACSYAIDRSKFHWPAEVKCDKFQNEDSCYDLFPPVQRLPVPEGPYLTGRSYRSVQQCQPITPNLICKSVLVPSEVRYEYFFTSLPLSDSQKNYFNHASTDEALYELSEYLPLLSSLWWERDQVFRDCANNLALLLCHLHLPVCPMNAQTVTQDLCRRITNRTSNCHTALTRLQKQRANFTWPPVQVNCFDSHWFSNSTRPNRYYYRPERIPPPPKNIRFNSRLSSRILIGFEATEFSDEPTLATGVLYRLKGSRETFTLNQTSRGKTSIQLSSLAPGKDYEIKVAALRSNSGFPGVFSTVTNNTYGRCQAETTGENLIQGVFSWGAADAQSTSVTDCPYGSLSSPFAEFVEDYFRATRYCYCNDNMCKVPYWDEPVTYGCDYKTFNDSSITQELSDLLQSILKGEKTPVDVGEELVNLTQNATGFEPVDVTYTALILESIVQVITDLYETGPSIVETVSNLLNIQPDILLESQRDSQTSSRILAALENYLEKVPIEIGENVTQDEGNLAIYSQVINEKNFKGAAAASLRDSLGEETQSSFAVYQNEHTVQPLASQVSLTLPRSLFQNLNIDRKAQTQRISFAVYRQTSLFQPLDRNTSNSNNQTVRKKNSFAIAGTVKGSNLTNLIDPVVSTYHPLEKAVEESTACVFWDFNLKGGSGDWSEDGCTYKGTKNGIVTCHCSHLTNFAILMDVYIADHNDEVHDKALSIISYIGCALSLLGLILTIITILIFKDLRSKAPTQILLNFCIAMSLTLVVFLAAAERSKTSSLTSCRAAAIALHYFVLTVFMWMAIEAFNMYQAFVKVLPKYHSRFIFKSCLVGWGLPAIIVIITAAVATDNYGDEHFCRLRGLPFQVAFLAPVVLILAGNSAAFAFILRSLLTSGKKVAADRKVSGLRQARRGAAILVVLGLTWLFGVLAVNDAKLIFQYLFCIFNSIQGFMVFLFYCILSVETRTKYKTLFCRKGKDYQYGHRRHPVSATEIRFQEIHPSQNPHSNLSTATSGVFSSLSKDVTDHNLQPLKTNQ